MHKMCQCGCSEFPVTEAYKLPSGEVIGIGFYRGCGDCFAGPGISVYVYPSAELGKEWLGGAEMHDFTPTEFGGNGGMGISLSFFEVEDLIKAAVEIGDDLGEGSYATVGEWLEENGLEMMQKAQERFEKRVQEIRNRLKGTDGNA